MKLKIIAFLFFTSISQSYAQIDFQEHSILGGIYSAAGLESTHPVDIDGDGDIDILCAANMVNKLAWYENEDGQGSFSRQKTISSDAENIKSVFAADLDGDGNMDVLAASAFDSEIIWYKNIDGQGNFGSKQIIPANLYSKSATLNASDIDGDGDIDILCSSVNPFGTSSSANNGRINWYENTDGLGTFVEHFLLSSGIEGANSVFAKDIDGDGDMDIVGSYAVDNQIVWFENTDGLGNFLKKPKLSFPSPEMAIPVDMDADGDTDILFKSSWNGEVYWFENIDGLGTYSEEQLVGGGNLIGNISSGDVDGDGDIDVLASGLNLSWFENTDGQGGFGPQQLISDKGGQSIYSNDIDGDGDIDFFTGSNSVDKIAWFENTDGQGNFGIQQIITSNPNPYYTIPIDLDLDGDIDVISALYGEDKIVWHENIDGQGNFGKTKVLAYDVLNVAEVYSSDIDGDGDLDLISAPYTSNEFALHENIDGQGNFGPKQIISTNEKYITDIKFTDIDGDGDMDIATSHLHSNEIAWYENTDGQGSYVAQQVLSTEISGTQSISLADLDGDGDLDLISDRVAWFENTDGQGDFGPEQILIAGLLYPRAVFVEDLDGDGDMDILYSSKVKIAWLENVDGQGSFNKEHLILDSYGTSIVAKDLDGDGDFDICYNSLNNLIWHENTDGQGVFGLPLAISDNGRWGNISIDDINSDGKVDVLVHTSSSGYAINKYHGSIMWYENIGLNSNRISGTIRLDTDSNGCDSDDLIVEGIMVETSNGMLTNATFSLRNGLFQFFPPQGDYTTIVQSAPDYYSSNPNSYFSSFVGTGNTEIVNFCLEPDQIINDLEVTLLPLTETRPGFDARNSIVYHNSGTTTLDGVVMLAFNSTQLEFLTASEPLSQTNDKLIFNYSGLAPFETRQIDLTFNVLASSVNIDDVISFTTTIDPLANDNAPENNTFTLDQTVIGSFDPNDISVLEGNQIPVTEIDNYLHYLIRFQNTGTASAINVKVNNFLDPRLDWETLRLENTSHIGRVEILNGNDVNFIFNNIHLPDSTTDEPESHGYIAYKIKPKADLVVGNIIYNEVDIYFDFNDPVRTNTVSTEIIELDVEAPTVICQDITLELDSTGNAFLSANDIDNGSTDNIGITMLTVNRDSFSCLDIGEIGIILTADDDEGNRDSCISTITILDNISPAVNSDLLPTIVADCELLDIAVPTATDNCTGLINGVSNIDLPITDQGTYNITWSYNDGNENIRSQNQTIIIKDETAPEVFTQNISIDLAGASFIEILPNQIDNGSSDNCAIQQMNLDKYTFTSIGDYTVVLSIEDVNNNIASKSATVTVINSTVSTLDHFFSNHITIHPNPVNDILKIRTESEIIKSVIVYNLLGEKIKHTSSEIIDLSELFEGIYLLEVTTSEGKKVFKKIIRKDM